MSSANNTTTPQASLEPNPTPPSDNTTPVTQEAAAASSSPTSSTTNAVAVTIGGPLTTMTAPTTALSASISATAAAGTAIATATGELVGVGSIQTPVTYTDGTTTNSTTAPAPVDTTTSTTTLAQSAQSAQPPQTVSSAQSNSTTAGTGATTNITGKKRPYRRTKRPTNYCDKSTITTVSGSNSTSAATFALSVNVYDAVLAESRDLLTAATEAQQLGRLKMAAAYQLLLHARLVGLGKRFDKAIVQTTNTSTGVATNDTVDHTNVNMDTTAVGEDDAAAVTTPGPQLQPSTPATPAAAIPAEASTTCTTQENNPDSASQVHIPPQLLQPPPTPTTAAARQLARLLPPTCELDQTMMEHLAKAAAELHAQRSGRKRNLALAVAAVDPDDLQTPDQFFAQTANQLQLPNAANSNPGIAWSAADVKQLTAAQESNKSVKEIATLVNKTEQQVKAYLRNLLARNKVEADLDELPLDANGTNAGTDQASAKKRGGGRGRKPATTAISTVPNAVCDARTLLQGKGIPKLTK
jgi:hypothetical protein